MSDFKLIKSTLNSEQRIQNMIDRFHKEFMDQEGSMEYAQKLLLIIDEYLCQFDDEEIYHAAYKIKECSFYLDLWMHK